MSDTTEVLKDWRYCHLEGKATVSKLGDIVLVYFEDPKINPKKDVLKFKDELNGRDSARQFKSVPVIDWTKGATQSFIFQELIAAFDERWFDFTIANGFMFKMKMGH